MQTILPQVKEPVPQFPPNSQPEGAKSKNVLLAAFFLLTGLLFGHNATAQLSGVYTINSALPASATNFTSFNAAITALNNGGNPTTPVTFNVAKQTFNEGTIPSITVSGTATSPIIFQEDGLTPTNLTDNPVVTRSTGGTGTTDTVLPISGGDYITFDGINVSSSSNTVEFGYLVRNASATNGAKFNTIKNARVVLNRTNTLSVGVMQSSAPATTSATTNGGGGIAATGTDGRNESNVYENLTIENSYRGIFFNSTTTTAANYDSNNIIRNSTVGSSTAGDIGAGSTATSGIQALKQGNLQIYNNEVRNVSGTSTLYGIFIDDNYGTSAVYNNKIHDIRNTSTTSTSILYGINASNEDVSTNANTLTIYNNFIYNLLHAYTGTTYTTRRVIGINISTGGDANGSQINVYYNSVRIETASTFTSSSTAFESGGTTTASILTLRNNIFTNYSVAPAAATTAGHSAIASSSATVFGNSGSTSDYNDLYAPNGIVGEGNTTDYATLANWQTAYGLDANSLSVDPQFVSATDLHLQTSSLLKGEGLAIAGITTDIDNEVRKLVPDIGGDELPATGTDIAVTAINGPTAPFAAGSIPVTVTIANLGATAISSIDVSYTFNGTTTTLTNVAIPSLAANATATYSLGNLNFIAGNNTLSVTITTSGDNDATNNTLGPVSYQTSLCGAYTINKNAATGGTNFASFSDAATALNTGGISCAVTFDVSNGPYTDQFTLGEIIGSSSTNTITVNGNLQTLTSAATTASTDNLGVINLNGTDYVTINGLVIISTATTTSAGIRLTNQADNNTLNGNTITMDQTVTASTLSGIAASGGTTVSTLGNSANNLTITNNTISGGYHGIIVNGASSSSRNTGLTISNNTISNFYIYGMDIEAFENPQVFNNNISRPTRATVSTFYGIYLSGVGGADIERNRIHDPFTGNTGSTSQASGIYFTASDGTASTPNDVVNNLVYNFNGSGIEYGIYNSSSAYSRYFHNSISLDNPAAISTASLTAGFYQTSPDVGIELQNNIFSVTRNNTGTGSKYAIYLNTTPTATSATITSNYNDLYVPTPGVGGYNTGYYNGADRATLADWQGANAGSLNGQSAFDLNSVQVDPLFTDAATGNLVPNAVALNNLGTPLARVPNDFTGMVRNNPPDMGAFEFTPTPLDLGAVSLVTPTESGCYTATEEVKVTIQNLGTTAIDFTLNNATVSGNVTGAATQTFGPVTISTGNLAPNATLDVVLGTLDMTAAGTYTFNATAGVAGETNTGNNAITPVNRIQAPIVAMPQIVDFTGYTGANLTTLFPNWHEAAGAAPTPAGTASGWTSDDFGNVAAGATGTSARIQLSTASDREWIIGPKVTATATTILKFDLALTASGATTAATLGSDDALQVMVSTDCGATFTAIRTYDASTPISNTGQLETISLGAYAGQNIIVAFYATEGTVDDAANNDLFLDNIFLGPPPAVDMGATVLVTPGTSGCYTAAEPVTVMIQNFGTSPIDFSVNPTTVTVNVSGAVTQPITKVINTGSLAAGGTQNVVVGTVNMRVAAGTYTFNGSTSVTGDGDASNNAMTQATRTVTAPLIALPQTVNFTGFTGSNLTTGFPNWREATGSAPAPTGTTSGWTEDDFGNVVGGLKGSAARITLDAASDDVWIIGPKVEATATTKLKFDLALTTSGTTNAGTLGSDDELKIMVSTDCGVNFTAIRTYNAASVISNILQMETVDLSAYAGQDIVVAFYATEGSVNDAADNDLFIDNLFLGTPPTLDLAATFLVSPGTKGCFSASESVIINVQNNGTEPIDFTVTPATITVNVTGAVTQPLNFTLNSGSLAAGAIQAVNMGTLNMSTVGTYTFNGSVSLTSDGNTANDAMLTAIRTVEAPVAMPQTIDFTGYTGTNLTALFPNWREAAEATPFGTTSGWTTSLSAQTTALGSATARINLLGTTRNEWIIGPKIAATANSTFKFSLAITETGTAGVDNTNGMTGTDDKVQVMVSTDCGATFAPIYTYSAGNTGAITNALKAQELSLAAFAGQNIIVAFYATDGPVDDPNTYDFHLDNIFLGDCTPGMWNGTISSAWDNLSNWSCGTLPTATTNVTVPANAFNFPEISTGTALAKDIVVLTGASLRISGGVLQLHGNLIDPAGFSQTGGLLELAGAGAQQLKGVSLTSLAVTGTGTKTFGSDIAVSNTMTMTSGLLNTSGFKLMLGSTATISESAASYVLGTVETVRNMATAAAEMFGGMGIELTPSATSAMPGITTMRRITGTAPANVGAGTGISRYFTVQATNNTGLDLAMVFRYLDHEFGAMDETKLKLYKSADAGTTWAPETASTLDGTLNLLSLPGVTDINQWWTAGEYLNPLPVELISFTAKKQEGNALLNWVTASEKDSKGFEIEVSTNGHDFRKIGFIESRNGNTMQHYTFTDKENGKAGIRYYRLKQVDLNGDLAYSEVEAVSFDNRNLLVSVYPNPFNSEVNLSIQALAAETATVTVTDLTGKTVLQKAVKVEAGLNQLKLQPANNLPAGAYLITVQVGAERFTSKLLKQ